jgi:hypothetical protein
MAATRAVVVADLASTELRPSRQPIYDREIGLRLLYEDPYSGAEHYVVRYPAGVVARWHRQTAAQTIVVLEGPAGGQRRDRGTRRLRSPSWRRADAPRARR